MILIVKKTQHHTSKSNSALKVLCFSSTGVESLYLHVCQFVPSENGELCIKIAVILRQLLKIFCKTQTESWHFNHILSVCFTIVIVAIVKLQNLCFANIVVGTVYDQPLASIFMLSIIFSEGERDKMFQILIR